MVIAGEVMIRLAGVLVDMAARWIIESETRDIEIVSNVLAFNGGRVL